MLVETGKLAIPAEISDQLAKLIADPPLSMELYKSIELPTELTAIPQYAQWGDDAKGRKQVELLKKHASTLEHFKVEKHKYQLEYDEWVKKIQNVLDNQSALSDKVLAMCDDIITGIILNDIRYINRRTPRHVYDPTRDSSYKK